MGGLKINGQQIARFNRNWRSSTIICVESNGAVTFTPLRDRSNINRTDNSASRKFAAGRSCLQTGDTLKTRTYSAAQLMQQRDPILTNNYWVAKQDRLLMVEFASKAIGFVSVPNANRLDTVRLLDRLTDNQGAPVSYAVNLNGGSRSGYIVRTREDPAIKGNMNFAFPAVFLIH